MVLFQLSNCTFKFFWVLLFLFSLTSTAKPTTVKNANPFELYPNNIIFNVFRDDALVGKHQITFTKLGEGRFRVNARLKLQVNFLSFPVYKLQYKSNAIWHRGKLKSLNSTTNDDGEIFTINVIKKNNRLIVVTKNKEFQTDVDILPTNHWNPEVLTKNNLINTLTGELSSVQITKLGKEKIDIRDKSIFATKYQYSGSINTFVWYSDRGNWVKMKFKGNDNSNIEYKCIECGT